MAGNNSIQILRGNNVKSTAADKILLDGQPLYDRTTGYLYVGESNTVANTLAVNAHYANSAGSASSATTAQQANAVKGYLYFKGSGRDASWNGSDNEVVYAPTSLGTRGQVWGMINSNRAGWIDQTEIPGTIEHANTANVAYEVSGSNVAGAVANANYSKVAGKVDSMLSLRVAGKGYGFDGFASLNIMDRNLVATNTAVDRGAIPYVSTNGTTSTPANFSWLAKGDDGQVLTATSTGIAWRDQSLPGNGYPYFVATIDNQTYEGIPITQSATYLLLRVVGGEGNISVSQRSGSSYIISLASISSVVLGVRVGSNQLTLAYPNGHTEYHTASGGFLAISIIPGGGTRFSLMKLSDE